MSLDCRVGKKMYAGLFFITLAVLMYEILLTRIFSVTMFYHFAFMAVSVSMFGLTSGAVIVYIFPDFFLQERARYHLALSSVLLAVTIPLSFLMHLSIPFFIHMSLVGIFSIVFTYAILSIPFIFGGICVCLALTKFPQQVSKLYAVDLIGAACGCLFLIVALEVTDGPTAVVLAAALVSVGAAFFAADGVSPKLSRFAVRMLILMSAFVTLNTVWIHHQGVSILKPIWVKGAPESTPLLEQWNSFSRIIVFGDPDEYIAPMGWNFSEAYQSDRKVRQLKLNIDADAATVLTAYDGSPASLEYLKYDLTNIAHYLRHDADVCIIGVGGGRDILSALAFQQKSVLGIEINPNIINTVNGFYGDFTGHLDQNPLVTFVNDEARSYITRQDKKFDIIESSFIDSWAATAAGAFVLTENSLYTVEAWKIFLEKLTPQGIVTFTRWYDEAAPDEIYRLTSLARASLLELGVREPRAHMFIVRKDTGATMLVSRAPFTAQDVDTIEKVARIMNFQILLSPVAFADPVLEKLASGEDLTQFYADFPANIIAPTDDTPFFFNTVRFRDMFTLMGGEQNGNNSMNSIAYFILGILLITVVCLSYLCIIVPIRSKERKLPPRKAWPLLGFFSAIGLGFMFIEIAEMQRLIIFLGHPTYALSVVLFALLLSSGIGSLLTSRFSDAPGKHAGLICLGSLLVCLLVFGISTPLLTSPYRASANMYRILIAVAILFPLGFFMGTAFPLGMKKASLADPSLTPWFFGANGAMSICASVLAVIISMGFGITATFWTGTLCYAIAFACYLFETMKKIPASGHGRS